ncbi:MAG: cbb3-type cytochrome oxidase maturation protein [Bacteroidia bacterium]|jgi:cbb3-type cytochrome oxidase maturation protein
MEVLFYVLPFALLLAAGALVAFLWAAKSGQFDDLETPSRRILLDDVPVDEGLVEDNESGPD